MPCSPSKEIQPKKLHSQGLSHYCLPGVQTLASQVLPWTGVPDVLSLTTPPTAVLFVLLSAQATEMPATQHSPLDG